MEDKELPSVLAVGQIPPEGQTKKKVTAKQKAAAERYVRDVESLRAAGHLDPVVHEGGCARCGGDLTVTTLVSPPDGMNSAVVTTGVSTCDVCRFDRVKRWGDLAAEATRAGLPSGGLDTETMTHVPTARALASAGLVQYDRTDGAWELTPAGLALLRAADIESRRISLAELAIRRERFEAEQARTLAYIDEKWPFGKEVTP